MRSPRSARKGPQDEPEDEPDDPEDDVHDRLDGPGYGVSTNLKHRSLLCELAGPFLAHHPAPPITDGQASLRHGIVDGQVATRHSGPWSQLRAGPPA